MYSVFIDFHVQLLQWSLEWKFLSVGYEESCYEENEAWQSPFALAVRPECYDKS